MWLVYLGMLYREVTMWLVYLGMLYREGWLVYLGMLYREGWLVYLGMLYLFIWARLHYDLFISLPGHYFGVCRLVVCL